MPNKPRAGITLVIAIVAFLAPVVGSAYLAWWESYATEKTLSISNAQDVMRRIEETSSNSKETLRDWRKLICRPARHKTSSSCARLISGPVI